MKRFTQLFAEIDRTTRTNEKVDAMTAYFAEADAADAAWAVYFLSGGRPKRLIPVRRLATWAMEIAAIPEWLFDECYDAVGDLAETISLLLPPATRPVERPLHEWIGEHVLGLAKLPEERQRESIRESWSSLDGVERFVWN